MSYRDLAAAIRKGCAFVEEQRLYSGCAIGTAYTARTGRNLSRDGSDDPREGSFCRIVSETFDVPLEIVVRASNMHYDGMRGVGPRYTREQVADWLDSLEPAAQQVETVPTATPSATAVAAAQLSITRAFIASMTEAVSRGEVVEHEEIK